MKKLFFGTVLLALVMAVPNQTMARVDVNINIGLPPLIVFAEPPELIVLPETYIYVVPDVEADIFFFNGWWWRPWEGRWYRSRYYDRGWAYYQRVPSFYHEIPSDWRNYYREHHWRGHPWNYRRIPHHQVRRNWRDWERSRYWEKQQTWDVQGLQPRTRSPHPSREFQPERSQRQYRETVPQTRESQPQRPQQQFRETAPQPHEGRPERQQEHRGNR